MHCLESTAYDARFEHALRLSFASLPWSVCPGPIFFDHGTPITYTWLCTCRFQGCILSFHKSSHLQTIAGHPPLLKPWGFGKWEPSPSSFSSPDSGNAKCVPSRLLDSFLCLSTLWILDDSFIDTFYLCGGCSPIVSNIWSFWHGHLQAQPHPSITTVVMQKRELNQSIPRNQQTAPLWISLKNMDGLGCLSGM